MGAEALSNHGTSGLHIVSWNVAGWKTTIEQITRLSGGLTQFLHKHAIDILCVQETKLTAKALSQGGRSLGADIADYESFWACNEGAGTQRQGLNGVATIARRGLVLRANSKPFDMPDLDNEARCIVTDIGHAVIFNVYVPNSSGGTRLSYKLRWLRALRVAMQKERAAGKVVILLGDLNMKSRPLDVHWSFRCVAHERVADFVQSELANPEALAAARQVHAEWQSIVSALRRKEHRQVETRNSTTGQVFQRWSVFVESRDGNFVKLGTPSSSLEDAEDSFFLDGMYCMEGGTVVRGCTPDEDTSYIVAKPGEISMSDLAECMKKISNVDIGVGGLRALADAIGKNTTSPAVQDWFESVLQDDGMVDSFAEVHPEAVERFTCWDQYRNKRHENVGSRIDHILVDRPFFEKYVVRGTSLSSGGRNDMDPNSANAALSSATLGGLSQPVSFAGGGMAKLEHDEYSMQFRDPSTGMIYTPPQLSDHIAVSLLLENLEPMVVEARSTFDTATQQCQPHKPSKKITDFFGKRASSGSVEPTKRREILVDLTCA